MLGDCLIRAGDELHLNVMAAQRNVRVYEWPTLFYPQRYEGYLTNGKNAGLLNFGLGSQSCIGKYLAESEVKIFTALFCILLQPKSEQDSEEKTAVFDDFKNQIIYFNNGFNISLPRRHEINGNSFSVRPEIQNYLGERAE